MHDKRFPIATDNMSAQKNGIRAMGEPGVRRHCHRNLLSRISLAGQRRFVDKEVARFEQSTIARNNRAGGQQHDIAGNDLFQWHTKLLRHRVARTLLFQRLRAIFPPRLLRRTPARNPVTRSQERLSE